MTIPAKQKAVADYLTSLTGGAAPTETHISAVFLGPSTVYKLKKAVRLSFLDFTRLDERERFLRRELELNQAAAPGLYRDVAAVVRTPTGTLKLTPKPAAMPLDWVLRMARVPAAHFLDVMAREDRLTPVLLDKLADTIAAYHATCPIRDIDFAESLEAVAEGNAVAAKDAGLPHDLITFWLRDMIAALGGLEFWLATRRAHGFIRRAHGDLHLGNLCLWRGQPVPFDALEFDENLATIDVAYDLAFLLMDLDQRVGRVAANRVLNRYVARTGDAALTIGLPIYLSMRAMVRAHVTKASNKPDSSRSPASANRITGETYLDAAGTYLEKVPPHVIAIGGLQGSGKSTLARALAPLIGNAPGALILRSDEIRKRLFKAAPEQRLGPEAYTPEANAEVDDALARLAFGVIRGGHSVIVDATFLDLALRHRMEDVAHNANVRFLGVWLDAPMAVLERRIAGRRHDASDATVAVLHQAAEHSPGAVTWLTVSALDQDAAIAKVLAALP